MSNNPPNTDETVFIPCEICDEPVAMENYMEHTNACNSARFIDFHGVSLADLLNPAQILNHLPVMPPEIDFADNLASEDERESEEHDEPEEEPEEDEIGSEDEGHMAGEPQPNVQIVPMAEIIRALMGDGFNPDELDGQHPPILQPQPQQHQQQAQEPPFIDNLMNRLQNLITAAMLGQQGVGGLGNLEDVVVGLTPEQQAYCLTAKTLSEPTTCNICCEENITEMTTLICGHELCMPCATKHFTKNVKCPFCNQDLRDISNSVS